MIDEKKKQFTLGGKTYFEGDYISLDGSTGKIFDGDIQTQEASISGNFGRIMSWADSPKIKENGNAYQPEEKTVKENRCCMVCWIPCSSGLCCGYYFIRFLNIRR